MKGAPLPFSLRQLQYAVAIADLLGFRKAAERCRVSQPSLSAQIGELEAVLGTRLFERDRRRVIVTPQGAELVERARAVLREAEDLAERARRLGDPLAGTLRIGVIPTLAPYLVPRIRPALRRAFPRLGVLWVEDKTDVVVEKLEAGELDGVLLALEAEIGDVEREVVGYDPFVLATPPGHPLGMKRAPVTPAELRDASVLLLDDGHCFRDQALAVCATADAQELEFRATSLTTLAQMVADGAGVTLMPALAVPTEAKRAGLVIRPFAEPAPGRTIALVWRKRSPVGPALTSVAATIREAFGAERPAPTPSREKRSTSRKPRAPKRTRPEARR
jgi:LysR family transcriptional regulator, hydrogen peroxide-inducible genes activator